MTEILELVERWLTVVLKFNTLVGVFFLGMAVSAIYFVVGLILWGPCQ